MGFRRGQPNLRAVPDEGESVNNHIARENYQDQMFAAVHLAIEEGHRTARLRRQRQAATVVSIEDDVDRAERRGEEEKAERFRIALDAYRDGLGE